MNRRPKLNPRQLYEKDIRNNAVRFTASLYVPGDGFTTVEAGTLGETQVLARQLWEGSKKIRPVLVNAVRADERYCAVGQWDKDGWKEFPI